MTLRPRYVGKNILIPGKLGNGKTLDAQDGLESATHGSIIRGKDLWLDQDSAVLQHTNLTFEHCRIVFRDTTALSLFAAHGLRMRWVQIIHASPPNNLDDFPQAGPFDTLEEYRSSQGPPPVVGAGGFGYNPALFPDDIPDSAMQLAVLVNDCEDIDILGLQVFDASSGIVTFDSSNIKVRKLEVIRPRGPFYRGQGLQFARSENCLLEDFHVQSPLNNSLPEDSISCYYSENCIIRRGLIDGNNAPLGVGVMLESSSYCLVEDVDAIDMGNGAFSSYGYYDAGNEVEPVYGHDNTFRRCRARDSHYMTKRGNPASGCFFQALSGTYNVEFEDCSWFNPAPEAGESPFEPDVTMPIEGVYLVQNGVNVVTRAEFTEIDFVARSPRVFTYPWDDWRGGPYSASLNIGPAQFKPYIDETISDSTFIGELSSLSADSNETFTWSFIGDYERFEIYDGNKVRSVSGVYNWDDYAIELLPIRSTGSRGQHLDRDMPVVINPINPVGAGLFDGFVAGEYGDDGLPPTGWTIEKSASVTLEFIEEDYIHPLHCLKIKMTTAPVLGEHFLKIFFPNGEVSYAATGGDEYRIRGYMARTDPLTLNNTAFSMVETNATILVTDHVLGMQLNEDLFSVYSRKSLDVVLGGSGTIDGVGGLIYFTHNFTAGEVTAGTPKVQTILIGAPRLIELV